MVVSLYDSGAAKEEPQLFTEELIEEYKDMLRHGVEEEIRWGGYVIGNHIEGLTMEMVSDYIHYLGNLRSNSLGFGSLYDGFENEPKSMEWVSMYANANLIKTDFLKHAPPLMRRAVRWWMICRQL